MTNLLEPNTESAFELVETPSRATESEMQVTVDWPQHEPAGADVSPPAQPVDIEGAVSSLPVVREAIGTKGNTRQVHFINGHNRPLAVAVAYANDSCTKLWAVQGWWNIAPGGDVHVLNTTNRYMFFYAESSDRVWAGDAWENHADAYVTQKAFNHCIEIGTTTSRIVRMRFLDLDVNTRWRLT